MLKCSLVSDWVILLQILKVWLSFVRHIYTALLLTWVVIVLKVLSVISWALGFFPHRKWPTQENEKAGGVKSRECLGRKDMALPECSTLAGHQ